MSKSDLEKIRDQIDQIDSELLRLLNRRAEFVLQVAEAKKAESGDQDAHFYRPEREAQLLSRLNEQNDGILSDDHIRRIFREIISSSLSLEEGLTIAYLGPPGTYSQSAVYKHFGSSVLSKPQGKIPEVFSAVTKNEAQYGVVPIENSTEGTVNLTLDCFLESDLKVCSEINLPIHHMLMIHNDTLESDIKVIYSHEQSFAQCRDWLTWQFPTIEQNVVSSNAEAAKRAAAETNSAAIASELCATRYNLKILHRRIEDQKSNTTRFWVLGKRPVAISGTDKTSLLVQTANKAGALVDLLIPFKEREISLSQVVSRPSKTGNWSYVFFIDFEGHIDDENVGHALAQVEQHTLEVKVLGSYPKAEDP